MGVDISDLYLIIFKEIKGLGYKKLESIYSKIGNFKKVFELSTEEFQKIINDKKILEAIRQIRINEDNIHNQIRELKNILEQKRIHFIPFFDKRYPNTLKKISNPPIYLLIKGNLIFDELQKSISIIGTRNPSFYGHKNTRKISKELAENGWVIISGLARGIDLEAHLGALEGGGKTIAILGSGLENIYPPEHSELVKDILKKGAIISEMRIDDKLNRFSLANRNRIMIALSQAALIIEGRLKSGTRYGANLSIKLKKPTFVLKPIDLKSENAQLPLKLLEKNAIQVINAGEILNFLKSNEIDSKSDIITGKNYEIIELEEEINVEILKKIGNWNTKPSNPFIQTVFNKLGINEVIKSFLDYYNKGYFVVRKYSNGFYSWKYFGNVIYKDEEKHIEIFFNNLDFFTSTDIISNFEKQSIIKQMDVLKYSLWRYIEEKLLYKNMKLATLYSQ
ncbi:MAG: DNA-processing protein DprA [Candidatus Helarchaeota archaeon]